jgi:hypothetical protein
MEVVTLILLAVYDDCIDENDGGNNRDTEAVSLYEYSRYVLIYHLNYYFEIIHFESVFY